VGASVEELPRCKFDACVHSSLCKPKSHLFAKFFPEPWDSKDFSEEDVCFLPCFRPFVELIEHICVLRVMQNGFVDDETPGCGVKSSLNIEAERVVKWSFEGSGFELRGKYLFESDLSRANAAF
jgi:hypothetical protein